MNSEQLKLIIQLCRNGLRHRYRRLTGKPGKPAAISFEITHDCIARCIMCNIWKIPARVPNLPIADWLTLLSSPVLNDLRELDVTGGEPFLRDDLIDLFDGICALKNTNLKKLRAVAVTTNGFLTRRVVATVEDIARRLHRGNIELVMVCAMDAAGPVHERIRRVKDAWPKLNDNHPGPDRPSPALSQPDHRCKDHHSAAQRQRARWNRRLCRSESSVYDYFALHHHERSVS